MPATKTKHPDAAVAVDTDSENAALAVAGMATPPVVIDQGATDLFSQAIDEFEELLGLPYIPKTDAARNATTFTALRVAERLQRDPDTDEVTPSWLILVALDEPAILAKRNSGETVEFEAGERALVTLKKSPGRDLLMEKLIAATAKGPVGHLCLKEIPLPAGSDPKNSNMVVLTTRSRWQSLADAKRARKG